MQKLTSDLTSTNSACDGASSMSNSGLFAQAQTLIPGGVNSPVRAFKSVGGTPIFIASAKGAHLVDVEGNRYIDYVMSWGPMVLGHAHPSVIEAVQQAATQGLSFGAPTALESQLASLLIQQVPSIEKVRLVNSGTEATMSAIRLARGMTGRSKILKFEGCYHGHADSLLVKAGSGALTLGVPTSPGILACTAEQTLTLAYNDADAVEACFAQYGDQIAGVIVEPVAGNMNLVLPTADFLNRLRQCCDQYASVLIFDEVMTGFRVGLQGAQGKYGVIPDLTTLGKVIGGGMPMGALGGRADIMEHLAPAGPVYQAGTLSGNPIATTAGLATLSLLLANDHFSQIEQATARLLHGLKALADQHQIPLTTHQAGSMFGVFFTTETEITQFQQVMACNSDHFKQFFHGMLQQGVYLAPSAFEAGFTSLAHTEAIIEQTLSAADQALAALS